jgi:hypothetical protein
VRVDLGIGVVIVAAVVTILSRTLVPLLSKLLEDALHAWLRRRARELVASAAQRLPPELQAIHAAPWQDEIATLLEDDELLRAVLTGARRNYDTRQLARAHAGDALRVQRLRQAITANRPAARLIRELWTAPAAGAAALTAEIGLLLLVATGMPAADAAVTGVAWALGIIMLVNAPALALTGTSSRATQSGWSQRHVFGYTLAVGAVGCAALAAIWSGALDAQVEQLLGLRGARWDATRGVLTGLMFAPLLVAVRRHALGRLMAAERTACVMPVTFARTATTIVLAAGFTQLLDAGTFGIGLALAIGVAVEASLLELHSRALALPDFARETPRALLAIARHHLPEAGATLLKVVPAVAVLFALGVSGGRTDSLVAWSIVCGLLWLISNLLFDVETLTVAQYRARAAATLQFATAIGIGITLLCIAVQFDPFTRDYLVDGSGLSPTAAEQALTAIVFITPFPFLAAMRAWLRGMLVAQGRSRIALVGVATGSVALAASMLIGVAIGVAPLLSASISASIGALVELCALVALARIAPARARVRLVV